MKTSIKTISLLASAVIFTLSSLSAVSTDPVGYKTVTIVGNNGLTPLGIELLSAPSFTGTITGVDLSAVVVAGADFDSLLDSATSYFLEVISSPTSSNIGLNTAISGWSGNELMLTDDISAVIGIGTDIVRVTGLPTISSIFGDGGDVIQGGTALQADLIFLPDPLTGQLVAHYYSTGGFAGIGWREIGSNEDKASKPIYFSDAILVFKRSSGDVDLVQSGSVKMNTTRVVSEQGYSAHSVLYPSGTTLGNSGLYDPDSPENSISVGSALTADLIFLDADRDGRLEPYYYSTGGFAGVGWRSIGSSADKASTPMNSGVTLLNRNRAFSLILSPSY
jgi:hypothetical protein